MLLSHFAKYRSLMPSLALIGHLIDGVDGQPTGPVSRAAAALAIACCEYLHGHARRIRSQDGPLLASVAAAGRVVVGTRKSIMLAASITIHKPAA